VKTRKKRTPSKKQDDIETKTETPNKFNNVQLEDHKKCPPSMPDYNPNTKKCVRKCKEGKVRNDNFRCVKKKV
jgi:hypothetical protein